MHNIYNLKKMLKIGIIGTANIAHSFTDAVQQSPNIKITAIASRNAESALAFKQKYNLEKSYASYQELLDDDDIDAVYIPLPNTLHAEWVIKAANAKKHILCEKPIAVSVQDVRDMYNAAAINNVLLMEAFPYRHQPQTIEMLNRIKNHEIGEVKQIYADFGFTIDDIENNIRLKPELGGGSVWDAGAYPVSIIRAITNAKPAEVFAFGQVNENQLDLSVSAMLRYQNGVVAQLNCSFCAAPHRIVRVIGSKGIISCGYNNLTKPHTAFIELKKGLDWNYELERIPVPHGSGFLFEAESFYSNVATFKQSYEGTTQQESLDNTETILAIIKSVKDNGDK